MLSQCKESCINLSPTHLILMHLLRAKFWGEFSDPCKYSSEHETIGEVETSSRQVSQTWRRQLIITGAMPYCTIPYHVRPLHTIPLHTILLHTRPLWVSIPCHCIPYGGIPYHTALPTKYNSMLHQTKPSHNITPHHNLPVPKLIKHITDSNISWVELSVQYKRAIDRKLVTARHNYRFCLRRTNYMHVVKHELYARSHWLLVNLVVRQPDLSERQQW